MKKFIILFFLINIVGIAQEKPVTKDAIYIVFESDKQQIKEEPIGINKYLQPVAVYKMYFDEEKKSYFMFTKSKYLDFDALEANTIADIKIVNKSFLKSHNEDVIDMKTFLKLGIEKSFWNLYNYKKIYLIDKSEIKNGKVIMYEVAIYSTYMPEI